jgi:hypothetical membrane protein
MDTSKKIRVFTEKYPSIGPLFWIVSLQFFITQFLVALTWPLPYSITKNAISDLGNTACGNFSDRYVCSPYFSWMNISFMLLGLTMLVGSRLIYEEFKKTKATKIGFIFMGLAGFGTMMVGIFPENLFGHFHAAGAALPFVLGNISLIIFGTSLGLPGWMKMYTILSGLIPLIALPFFLAELYFGFGFGGMERIVAYPQTIWIIFFGIYMTKDRFSEIAASTAQRLGI